MKSLTHAVYLQKTRGLLFVALIALISYALVQIPFMAHSGISSLIIAIVLGILIGNSWHLPATFTPGIQFAAKRILRTAIVLYGFRITLQQIASVGWYALILDCIVVSFTLLLGYYIGKKILKLDRELSLLISVGAAICGAAAVLAAEDILKSEPYKATVAVATVVIFGTISMFLYPTLQQMNVFGFSEHQFGLFAGASIHEVAQALAAGTNINVETGEVAVIVKMIRVLLLVPVLLILAFLQQRFFSQSHHKKNKLQIPWFALVFVAVILFNSLHLLPAALVNVINQIDIILLTMAMAAIGVETKWGKVKHVGTKPIYLALILFIWLMASVFVLVKI